MKTLHSITVFLILVTPVVLFQINSPEYSSIITIHKVIGRDFVSMNQADTEKYRHPHINLPPGPGIAVILADSSMIYNDFINVRISKVVAYGSSTPALPKGSRINLQVSGILLHKKNLTDLCSGINSGKDDTLVIEYRAVSGLGVHGTHWTLIRIY